MSDIRKTAEAILELDEKDHGPHILSCWGPGDHLQIDIELADLKALARSHIELLEAAKDVIADVRLLEFDAHLTDPAAFARLRSAVEGVEG